ncbi:MAG: DnaD domain-containing protein [Anaerococcus sp.]
MTGDNLKFQMQNVEMDMGTTSFENMFLNTYVQMADGDSLKSFLLIYKDACNGGVDTEKIQKQLGFDDETFNKTIEYWINMGLFRKKEANNGQEYIEIVSLRQAYFGSKSSEQIIENKEAIDKAERRSVMFNSVERIINRKLTPNDITRIHETIDEYNSDPELVTEAFRQAREVGNMDVKYVMGFLKTWRDQNIFSLNDLKIQEERRKLLRKKSPRQYKKTKKPPIPSSIDNEESFAQKVREERLRRMEELRNKG